MLHGVAVRNAYEWQINQNDEFNMFRNSQMD